MTTSIRITSGFSARAWKIASRPVPASPTGSMSGSCARRSRMPERTTAWSSTISTRTGAATAETLSSPTAALRRRLHPPVEHRLDLGRQALPLREAGLDDRPHTASLLERAGESLERRDETEVVERGGAQLDGEAAHVLERLDDELAHLVLGALGL